MRTRAMPAARRLAGIACAVALACAGIGVPAAAAPEQVPDRLPLLAEPLERGDLLLTPGPARGPSTKTTDGSIDDWKGKPSGIGGTARLDRGEHIYTDFLFDDFGADDGDDAERLAVLGPLREAESRTARLDQLFQAAGDQFDAPRPLGAPDRYGDSERTGTTDLREVRWAAGSKRIHLLARTTTMTDAGLALLVLADTDGKKGAARAVGFGSGLQSERFDTAMLLTAAGVKQFDLATQTTRRVTGGRVAVNHAGWTNAFEASFSASLLPKKVDVAVVAGHVAGKTFTPANVAYRFDEPVAGVYNDQHQALALHAGTVDAFTARLNLARLRRGASQHARPGAGYAERHMRSADNISREEGEHGIWQPYGLYVPVSYKPTERTPLTFWLHYRGGKAHSGGAWTPRLITQLGEETGNIVVTPRGRGTSTWYVTEAHQDFFEVFADIHGLLSIDPDRRYLSGYSMGGYGTYLFGLLYPDLFAAGYSTSGAVTQGAWTGEGPDDCSTGQCYIEANNGDADAQLTYRVLENARHFPITIHHGTNDELVPVTGVQRMGVRLAELGYRYDMTMFTGYEHFTQAIIDEWADGATYINQFTRPRNPRDVTYKVVPALVNAVNTVTADGVAFDFRPDGAYWTDGLVVRDGDPTDTAVFGQLDVTSYAIPGQTTVPLPRTGVVSPAGHSTPYTRHGLDWLPISSQLQRNGFSSKLVNLRRATLDIRRMGLKASEEIDGSVTTDGPTTLVLTNVARTVKVIVNGAVVGSGTGTVEVPVEAGTHSVTLRP